MLHTIRPTIVVNFGNESETFNLVERIVGPVPNFGRPAVVEDIPAGKGLAGEVRTYARKSDIFYPKVHISEDDAAEFGVEACERDDDGYLCTCEAIAEVTYERDGRTYKAFVPRPELVAEDFDDEDGRPYSEDVKGFSMPADPVVKDVLFGYDVEDFSTDTVTEKLVKCWYCPEDEHRFFYSDFSRLVPQAYDEERTQRAFCYAMLEHFQAHRDADDLPYVTTVFPGKTVYRPDGSVAATKPSVTRRWKINGKLLGPSAKWFDPTERQASIASRESWLALAE